MMCIALLHQEMAISNKHHSLLCFSIREIIFSHSAEAKYTAEERKAVQVRDEEAKSKVIVCTRWAILVLTYNSNYDNQ